MSQYTIMFLTMGSVFIGFCFFFAGYALKTYDKPMRVVVGFIVTAFFFVLLVPLLIAIFLATGFVGNAV